MVIVFGVVLYSAYFLAMFAALGILLWVVFNYKTVIEAIDAGVTDQQDSSE